MADRSRGVGNVPSRKRPLQRMTLARQVYDELRRMLLVHELPEGTALSEVELGRMLGVSPTPVREALNLLRGEGLVFSDPGIGTFVARFSDQDVLQIMDLRETLECKALQEVAHLLTAEDFEELRQLQQRYISSYKDHDPVDRIAAAEANAALHLFFARRLGNRWLTEMLERLTSYMDLIRAPITSRSNGLQSAGEHQLFLDALQAAETDRAVELLAVHLRRVTEDLIAVRRAGAQEIEPEQEAGSS